MQNIQIFTFNSSGLVKDSCAHYLQPSETMATKISSYTYIKISCVLRFSIFKFLKGMAMATQNPNNHIQ